MPFLKFSNLGARLLGWNPNPHADFWVEVAIPDAGFKWTGSGLTGSSQARSSRAVDFLRLNPGGPIV